MSQARRQRRQMYKQFGLLGNKSPRAKEIMNYLKKMREEVVFDENNESIDEVVDEMLEDVVEGTETTEDHLEAVEVKNVEENDTEQEG